MSKCVELILPWPPQELSPNARVHWSKKAKAVKSARKLAFLEAKLIGLIAPESDNKLHLWVDFYRKIRNEPDGDNMLARSKAYIDGIADCVGVNDSRFVCHPFIKDELGGVVVFRITTGPNG